MVKPGSLERGRCRQEEISQHGSFHAVCEAESREALFIEEAHGSAVAPFDKRTKCHGEVVFFCGFFEVFIGGLFAQGFGCELADVGRLVAANVFRALFEQASERFFFRHGVAQELARSLAFSIGERRVFSLAALFPMLFKEGFERVRFFCRFVLALFSIGAPKLLFVGRRPFVAAAKVAIEASSEIGFAHVFQGEALLHLGKDFLVVLKERFF